MKKKQNTLLASITAETGGILGYLDDSEVAEKLEAIEALPTWHKRKRKKRR